MLDKLSYDRIQSFKKNILSLGRFIQEILNKLEIAVIEKNSTMNRIVIFSEDIINDFYNNLFKEYNSVYNLVYVTGSNLRFLTTAHNLIFLLNEIGLLLVEISKTNRFLLNKDSAVFNEQMKLCFKTLKAMLRETIDNYISASYEKSAKICKMKDFLQKLISNLEYEISDYISENPEAGSKILKIYNIFKLINDISDKTIKINETSFYIENAKIYKCINVSFEEIE